MKDVEIISEARHPERDIRYITFSVSGFRLHAAQHNQRGFEELVAKVRAELARGLRVLDRPEEA